MQDNPFRFLTDEEFAKLTTDEKATYLTLASQELEKRQRRLREYMQAFVKEQKEGR